MTLKERIRDFIWFMFRDKYKCPVCKSEYIVKATFPPYVFCSDCGWELREGYFK